MCLIERYDPSFDFLPLMRLLLISLRSMGGIMRETLIIPLSLPIFDF